MNPMSESAKNWIFKFVINFTNFVVFVQSKFAFFATFWHEMWSAHYNDDLLWYLKRQNVTNLSADFHLERTYFRVMSEIDICIEAGRFVPKRCKIILKLQTFWTKCYNFLGQKYVFSSIFFKICSLGCWISEISKATEWFQF